MNSPTALLSIATDNNAFADGNRNVELARILHKLADRLTDGTYSHESEFTLVLRDSNGNPVGRFTV